MTSYINYKCLKNIMKVTNYSSSYYCVNSYSIIFYTMQDLKGFTLLIA